MAERTTPRSNPISRILAPRNFLTALIAILLPFLIIPLLMGYLGYTRVRSSLYSDASSQLQATGKTTNQQMADWQSSLLQRVQSVSQNPALVTAAGKSSPEQMLIFANSASPVGNLITDWVVVDVNQQQIAAATDSSWIGRSLSGDAAPVQDWNSPFSSVLINNPGFTASGLTFLSGAPVKNGSSLTGYMLIGVANPADVAAALRTALQTKSAEAVYFTVNDRYIVALSADGTALGKPELLLASFSLPSAAGSTSEYTDLASRAVIGYIQPIDWIEPEGASAAVTAPVVKVMVEETQATAYAPAGYLAGLLALLFSGILAAGLLAVLQATTFIVRPMRSITAAISRFASGHMDEPIPVFGTAEFASLSSSLNRLTGELRDVSHLIGTGSQITTTRKVVVTSELTQSLAKAPSQDDILRLVINLIHDRLGFDFTAVYLVDDAGQFATVRDATGPAGERLKAQGNRFPLGSYSIIGSVAQSGKAHLAANVSDDPMFIRNDLLPDTRSEAAVPIRVGKKVVGVLDIHSMTPNSFSNEDVDLLQSIADQTSTAMQNVQVLEAAHVNLEVSQQLFRTGRLIAAASKPEEIYTATLEGLKGAAYIVTLLQSSDTALQIVGFFDPVNPQAEQPPVASIGETPDALSRLIPGNAPLVLKVTSELTRIPPNIRQYLEGLGARVAGFLPLRRGDELIGAVMLAARDENAVTMARVRTLLPISEQILSALERLDLLRSTQDRLNELTTLNRISLSISQALDPQGLFEIVHEQTRNVLGDVDITIAMYDSNRDLLTFPYSFLGGETVSLDPMPLGESLYGMVVRNAQPLMLSENVEERAASLGVHLTGTPPLSWLGVPLVTANQVVGVIALQYTAAQNSQLTDEEMELMRAGMYRPTQERPFKRFTDNDLRLMTTIAAQIASTIRTSSLLAESERKAVQLQTAAEIARETIGLLDLDRLLTHSTNLIRERFGFYHSSVFLLDEERKFAVLRESTGEAGRQMKSRGHKLGVGSQSIVGWVTENARPRVADDVAADPMHRANPLLPATRSELGIPLRIGETVIGALDVQSTTPYAFAPDDITILQVISDQIAIAVENARLFSTTRDYLARHRSLYQVTTAAASSTTVDNALFSAAQGLRVTMNGARVAIFLLTPEKDALIIRAHAGFGSREIEKMRITLGQGVPGWVATNKQPSLVASTATDSRYLMIDADVQSELCVPLIHRDELLGVLDMQSPVISAFTEDDVQLLGTVASSLAAIMSSTVLFEQVTQERERLRNLYEEAIGMAGPPAGDMESLLRTALERVRTVSGADCVSIAFPSGPDEARIEMCTCEPHFRHLNGLVAHYGQDVIGEAISEGTAVKYTPASTGTLSRSLAQAGIHTALALPLQWTGRTIGGLLLSRMSSDRGFSNEETQLANLLALQVAANIESARLFDTTRRQAEREHQLYEITSRIRRSVDMQSILSTTASEISKALGAKRATIKIGLVESQEGPGNGGEESAEHPNSA